MMDLLVSDTSVLVDLGRGRLLHDAFRLAFRFVVPDLLYEREIKDYGGPDLLALGLEIAALTGAEVAAAQRQQCERPALSTPDVFALALAASRGGILLRKL